jgi:predicted PurR-regulated permease PerM
MISTEHKKYIIYLLKYLGVALISGSVVHVGTLHNGTTRYIILGLIGLILMVIGNILESKQTGEKIDFRYFLIITALSLATGFFSGGIQHYLDNPGYAGYLLAIGLVFSYIIFFLRDKIRLYWKNIIIVILIAIGIIFVSLSLPVRATPDHHVSDAPTESVATTSSTSAHIDPTDAPAHTH